MCLADLDANFLKSIGSLHSNEFLFSGEPSALQVALEEAIKAKTGATKDLTSIIATTVRQQRIEELKATALNEESKTASSSDNELELDLLKEDLMCVVCNGMDVGARNRLLECTDCHSLYHQECHTPVVTSLETDDSWVCENCKTDRRLKQRSSPTPLSAKQQTVAPVTKPFAINSSRNHRSGSSSHGKNNSSSSKCNAGKTSSPTSRPSSSSSSSSSSSAAAAAAAAAVSPSSSSSSSSKPAATSSVNIINVDKRFQIMKKKAAKLQESKRKVTH